MLDIMAKFESVSKMIHSVDMLGLTVPLRPRWDALRKVQCNSQKSTPLLTDRLFRILLGCCGNSELLQVISPGVSKVCHELGIEISFDKVLINLFSVLHDGPTDGCITVRW